LETKKPQNKHHASSPARRQAARNVLLLCTTTAVSPQNKERLSRILAEPVDWEYLLDLASFHGVMPLITHNLVVNGFSSQVPQPCLDELKQTYHGTMYRNLILYSELAKILSTFNEHGVETICLKGAPLAESLYGNPYLRHVGDMDILVHPEDVAKGGALLADLGYQQDVTQQNNNHPFHGKPFWKKANFLLVVELHWHLDDGKLVSFSEPEIWRRAQPLQFEGVSTLVLSPEDNSLFLANHLFKHDSSLLRLLADIAELVKKHEESLDWDYIGSSAHAWQVAPAAYFALIRIKELTDAPVPDSMLEAVKPGICRRWLIDYLLSRETFISPIRDRRLRDWTAHAIRSLMMKGTREMRLVLSRQEGTGKTGKWLRILFWVLWIVAAATWRNGARAFSRQWSPIYP
jgi:hypothetical protein